PQPLHTGPSNRSKSGSGYIWLAKATIDLISAERQVAVSNPRVARSGRDQAQYGNFRWRAEAFGRPPVAGATTGVDHQPTEPAQAGGKGLLQRHEVIPRPELAAMGVAGKLQGEAGSFSSACRTRLVSEENARQVGWAAGQCRLRIAGLGRIEGAGRKVGHPGQDEAGTPVGDDDVAVVQATQSDPLEFTHPGRRTGVVLVVAGHHIAAMPAAQAAERRGMGAQVLDAAIDHVAGYGDQIGIELIDAVDDGLDVFALDRGPDMNVAELDDGESGQFRREIGQWDIHPYDASDPPRIDVADQREQAGQ